MLDLNKFQKNGDLAKSKLIKCKTVVDTGDIFPFVDTFYCWKNAILQRKPDVSTQEHRKTNYGWFNSGFLYILLILILI